MIGDSYFSSIDAISEGAKRKMVSAIVPLLPLFKIYARYVLPNQTGICRYAHVILIIIYLKSGAHIH